MGCSTVVVEYILVSCGEGPIDLLSRFTVFSTLNENEYIYMIYMNDTIVVSTKDLSFCKTNESRH